MVQGVYTISLQNSTTTALEAILKYIYTAKIDINPVNVEEILSAAKELGIDDLICMAADYLNSLSIGDVLDFMTNMLNKEGSELIVYDLYSYMMSHLDKISRTPEYLKSNISVIKALLGDSHLMVESEIEVFDAAIRWITFDKTNRFKYLSELMRSVRFTQMRPEVLVSKIESYQCLKDNPDINKMLYNAFKYHALNCSQSKLTNFMQREECRNACLKGASVPDEFVKAVEELSVIAHRLKEARTYTTSNLLNFNNTEECIQIKSKNGKTRVCRTSNLNNNNNNNNNNKESETDNIQSKDKIIVKESSDSVGSEIFNTSKNKQNQFRVYDLKKSPRSKSDMATIKSDLSSKTFETKIKNEKDCNCSKCCEFQIETVSALSSSFFSNCKNQYLDQDGRNYSAYKINF